DARPELEKAILALTKDEILQTEHVLDEVPELSREFVEKLVETPGLEKLLRTLVDSQRVSASQWGLLEGWIREDHGVLTRIALTKYVTALTHRFEPARAKADLFPILVARIRPSEFPNVAGLWEYAKRMTKGLLLEALDERLGAAESWSGEQKDSPFASMLLAALADGLEAHELTPEEMRTYAGLFTRWVAILSTPDHGAQWGSPPIDGHVRFLLRGLPEEEAVAWVGELIAANKQRARHLALGFPLERPGDVRVLVAGLQAAGEQGWGFFFQRLYRLSPDADLDPELRSAVVRALPGFLRAAPSEAGSLSVKLVEHGVHLPPAEAGEAVIAFVREAQRHPRGVVSHVLKWTLQLGHSKLSESDARFRREVCIPLLGTIWEMVGAEAREPLFREAMSCVSLEQSGKTALLDARETLASFLRARLTTERVKTQDCWTMARSPDLFPLLEWAPLVPPTLWNAGQFRQLADPAKIDSAARKFAEDPEKMDLMVLEFLWSGPSPEVRAEVVNRLLTTLDGDMLTQLGHRLNAENGYPASPDAMEDALGRALAKQPPDLGQVSRFAYILARVRPTERLFPAARALLASTYRAHVMTGVTLAKRLGREELLPDLAKLLDSMHEETRTMAKSAIDSILELKRIKTEADNLTK
ncbi:MAG: hypothetical protein ACYTDY_19460, partial [Planctomycetota bacterium]